MNDILKTVLSLSLSGSLLMVTILLMKPMLKNRVSRRWQYYVWLIVIARLLLPLSPEEEPPPGSTSFFLLYTAPVDALISYSYSCVAV